MTASRTVHHHEALTWLAANAAASGTSVVTSLPDVSELPGLDFDAWRSWFLAAVAAVLGWVPRDGVAIFYQTDVLQRGAWVDKSFLVQRCRAASGCSLAWHKIVCTTPPGSVSVGRAGYSHLLCFAHGPEPAFRDPTPDVLPAGGAKASQKAMGVEASLFACRYVRATTLARLIVDPFCGRGTVLAAANALGLDALGIDHSARCCRQARTLTFAA